MKKSIIAMLAVGLSSSLALATSVKENMTDTEAATKSLGSALEKEMEGMNTTPVNQAAEESSYDRTISTSEASRDPSEVSSSSSTATTRSPSNNGSSSSSAGAAMGGAAVGAAGVTAMDQASTGQSDTDLTRRVRQSLVNDPGLSVRAKNITVISEGGNITLKGAVATNQEKARVEELAEGVQGARNVDNQTEVSNY
ncbi:BON domain-containing protein [Bdellovibrio bacteriovorus]|uniref:BON domain-containing protein n=1 Tax=Bdellovibrio bacteriovorus TaxID=959 RepID=UPI0035A583F5